MTTQRGMQSLLYTEGLKFYKSTIPGRVLTLSVTATVSTCSDFVRPRTTAIFIFTSYIYKSCWQLKI